MNRHSISLVMLASLLAIVALLPRVALAQTPSPLFSIGIQGGFTGAQMTATVYADGSVVVKRQGAGRSAHESTNTVPVSLSAEKAAVALAKKRRIFTIPAAQQNAVIGADIPVRSLTIYGPTGARSVHAMGGDESHATGTGRFFPIWGLFYALAGYPSQIG